MSTHKDTAGPPALAQHRRHTLPPPAWQRLAPPHSPCSLPYFRRDLHLVWLKPELICKTGKSKWFSPIRRQGYGQAQSEAVQQMMFSTEKSFLLDSLLYLAEKHSEDICWSSSPTQQSLQTKVALFKQGAHHSLQIKAKNHCSHLFLPNAATQQSSVLDPQPPVPLEQNDAVSCVCMAPTTSATIPNQAHQYYWMQTKPGMFETIKQQMQQKWINLYLNKGKSQWKVKHDKLEGSSFEESWKERCQNGTFHTISWNWKMSQSQHI